MILSVITLLFAVFVTIYSTIRAFQVWQLEGWMMKLFSIIFALIAVSMASCVYEGIRELLL